MVYICKDIAKVWNKALKDTAQSTSIYLITRIKVNITLRELI